MLKNHSGAREILYICGPLFLYLIVNMVTGAAMETAWLYGLRDRVLAADSAATSYAVFAVWSTLCLVIPAGAGCFSVRKCALQALASFRRGRNAESDLSAAALSVLFVTAICLALGINLLCSLFAAGADLSAGLSGALPGAAGFVLLAVVYGIYMPFIEEILFRAILFGRIKSSLGRYAPVSEDTAQKQRFEKLCTSKAVLLSAALFGLYHGAVLQGIYAFAMGVLFAAAYERTGRFSVPWGLHGACNLCILLLQWTDRYQALCTPGWTAAFFVLAAGGLRTILRMQKHPGAGT